MKTILLTAITFLSLNVHALTMNDLKGTYTVDFVDEDIPVSNVIKINPTNNRTAMIELSEYNIHSNEPLKCYGKAFLKNLIVSSTLNCGNDRVFKLKIDMKKVKNLKTFEAPVYSSLLEDTFMMKFEKK